jgi:hypothetical protein
MSALQYMVSVDGKDAPTRVHETIADARNHAERLAKLPENMNSVIRVLMVVAILRTSGTYTTASYWDQGIKP